MADLIKVVKVFEIPEWYDISDAELRKLLDLVKEASCAQEARLFRLLDYSAFCDEENCYLHGDFSRRSGSH